jgi:hypothetical protein
MRLNLPVIDTIFDNVVTVKFAIKIENENSEKQFLEKILDLFKGKDIITEKLYDYYAFKV